MVENVRARERASGSEPPTGIRRVGRSILAVAGGNATATALGVVGGLLAARFVAPETAGAYRAYTIPMMYLTFLHLGTFDGLGRQLPFLVGQGRQAEAEAAAGAAARWNLFVAAAISVAFVLLGTWDLSHWDLQGAGGWASQALVAWWVFYGGYLGTTYRTLDHFVALARVQVVQAVANFLLVLTLPVLGFFGLCLRSAIPAAAGTWLLHRARPLDPPRARNRQPLIDLIRIGLPFCFWGSLYTSTWNAIESSLLLALGGVKSLGLFAVAIVLREGICVLPQAMSQVILPRVVEAYGREQRLVSANRLMFRLVLPATAGMAVLVLLASLALDVLVPTLIPKYHEGLGLMKLSLWAGVVQAAALPLGVLFASGKSWSLGRGVLVGLIVFPATVFLLAPHLGGAMAVVAGSLAGRLVRTGVGYWDLLRLTRQEQP